MDATGGCFASKLVPSHVFRENYSKILIDMDSPPRPQPGDKFEAQVSEIYPRVTVRIF